jgi:hypothetical protein
VLVAVKSDRVTWVRARVATAPLTYNCRVSVPAPTSARQMLRPASANVHPVTARAPLIAGRAEGAACHTTLWPLEPESSAVSRNDADRRYTPSASCTTMSSDIASFSDRTAACAPDSEHGWALEHVVPLPDGEA